LDLSTINFRFFADFNGFFGKLEKLPKAHFPWAFPLFIFSVTELSTGFEQLLHGFSCMSRIGKSAFLPKRSFFRFPAHCSQNALDFVYKI